MADRPKTTFFGKVFNRSKDPENERKVLSLDKRERREDGTWKSVKPSFIEYEDGSRLMLPEHLVMKFFEGQGNEIGNCYFTEFADSKKPNPSDFDDGGEIPF